LQQKEAACAGKKAAELSFIKSAPQLQNKKVKLADTTSAISLAWVSTRLFPLLLFFQQLLHF